MCSSTMRILHFIWWLIGSGLVKGVDKVGEIAEDDIKVMFDTNVTGLINVTSATI
jgi:NADP-dependent 3-hydroxy acid dehydrogenase YdfG